MKPGDKVILRGTWPEYDGLVRVDVGGVSASTSYPWEPDPGEEFEDLKVCLCGHSYLTHIYEAGACRPGWECASRCEGFRTTYVRKQPPEPPHKHEFALVEERHIRCKSCNKLWTETQ